MRTASVLTVSPSMLCTGGGVCSGGCTWSRGGCVCSGGVCLLGEGVCVCSGGCAWSWGESALRGVSASGRCLLLGGVPGPGGVCSWGVSGTPPPVNRMTNRCKNITLPQTSFVGGNKKVLAFWYCRLSQKVP